jgi:cellobiose epimerase
VDREGGGFLSDLDRPGRPFGPQHRMLEYQARQARNAARLALAFPAQSHWRELAIHGFRYLRDRQWDHQHGSWQCLLDASNTTRVYAAFVLANL